jgi:hypothetical protein
MAVENHGISLASEDNSCPVTMKCWKFDTEEAFKTYMGNRVKNRLLDIEGTTDLAAHYDSIATTGFADNRLKEIFSEKLPPEPWKIGEALAECFLEDADNVRFPWNGCRDQKVDAASLPGADLVGFKGQNENVRFLFGEVKTSDDASNRPPKVMYGRTGMTTQLENLKTSAETRRLLVKWFGFRAKNSSWESDYRTSLTAYISSDECVCLQGALVRDCEPDIKDLASRGKALSINIPANMGISLYGIYCSCGITDFPALMGGVSLS